MPTNKPTIIALERLSELINRLDTKPTQDLIDEIKAWNRLLRKHLTHQKHQDGKWKNDRYEYDKRTKRIKRLRDGEIIAEY